METAYFIGLVYVILGVILLFLGNRLAKVALGALGAVIGVSIGQKLVSLLSLRENWAFLTMLVLLLSMSYLAIRFYKLFISTSIGYVLVLITYALTVSWNWRNIAAVVIALTIGVSVSFLIYRTNIMEIAFKLVTSLQGATILAAGVYVMCNINRVPTLQTDQYSTMQGASAWWVLFWVVAFMAGLSFQLRQSSEIQKVGVNFGP